MARKPEWQVIKRRKLVKAAHSDPEAAEALEEYNELAKHGERPIIERRTNGKFVEYRVRDRDA